MKQSDFVLSLAQRLLLLFCMFLVCYILTFAVSYVIGRVLSGNLPAALRISALAQDVLAFILPAVGTSVLITRRPAELLCLIRRPKAIVLLLVGCCTIVSIPFQEAIIYWNYHIELPEAMSAFENAMRQLENAASESMAALMGDTSWASLILNILIIGIAAAVAEELIFRGCFQRILTTAGINRHLAVWLVAFFFSAMHMQFFGFVPRLLLGAYFGYLLLWTGSIAVPITAHMLNNTLYVITAWYQLRNGDTDVLAQEPHLWHLTATAASVALTAVIVFGIYRLSKNNSGTIS